MNQNTMQSLQGLLRGWTDGPKIVVVPSLKVAALVRPFLGDSELLVEYDLRSTISYVKWLIERSINKVSRTYILVVPEADSDVAEQFKAEHADVANINIHLI